MKREKRSYPELYRWVYSKQSLYKTLGIVDKLAVAFVSLSYFASLLLSLLSSLILTLEIFFFTFFPFVAVSLFRRLFNAPRPYELFDFAELGLPVPKSRRGSSFPSRHVFSAFLIGSILWFREPVFGFAVIASGALVAISRVLLGKHFVRDVIAGAVVGGISGVVGGILIALDVFR